MYTSAFEWIMRHPNNSDKKCLWYYVVTETFLQRKASINTHIYTVHTHTQSFSRVVCCFDEIGIDTFCAVICHIFTRLRSSPFWDRLIYQSSCSLSLSVSHIDSSGVTDEDMRTPEIGQSPEACRSLHHVSFVSLSALLYLTASQTQIHHHPDCMKIKSPPDLKQYRPFFCQRRPSRFTWKKTQNKTKHTLETENTQKEMKRQRVCFFSQCAQIRKHDLEHFFFPGSFRDCNKFFRTLQETCGAH